jgi:hypothetical protein
VNSDASSIASTAKPLSLPSFLIAAMPSSIEDGRDPAVRE